MKSIGTIAIGFLLAAAPLEAGYEIEVTSLPEVKKLRTVAVDPLRCATGINCLWIERKLAEDLRGIGWRVVSAAQLRQLALELGKEDPATLEKEELAEFYAAALERFKFDALVYAFVSDGETVTVGTVGGVTDTGAYGTYAWSAPTGYSKASATLKIWADGKVILRGSGQAASDWKDIEGTARTIFKRILKKATR